MKISKFLCAAFVSAALTGCCGTHLSTEEVHQFNLNQDTEAVVKAKLGEPWQTFYSVDRLHSPDRRLYFQFQSAAEP